MKHLFIVGEAPGTHPRHDPDRHALFPYPPRCSGARLMEFMGLSMSEYIAIPRRNVFREYPGRCGRGAKFPRAQAREKAKAMLPMLRDYDVMLVGTRTARAFGIESPEFFKWRLGPELGLTLCVIPHTSALNRWWHDEANKATAVEFLEATGREWLELHRNSYVGKSPRVAPGEQPRA